VAVRRVAWVSLEVVVAVGLASLLTNVASGRLPGWLSEPWVVFPALAMVLAGVVVLTVRRQRIESDIQAAETGVDPNLVEMVCARPLLDPPYQSLRSGAPEVWLLQQRFGMVPYIGREELLGDLEAWCADDEQFSIAVIAGEGGSGKSRLAAELCVRMQARAWEAGLVSRTEVLTEFAPESSALLVIDYPEQWFAVLGPALERLASRVAGPRVRVLLLARQSAERSHWWADLDRASHRTASLFTTVHRDLAEHPLSLPERRLHARAASRVFGEYLGVEVSAVPDVTDEEFANPLLVQVAA
jgi:hypothetical protein